MAATAQAFNIEGAIRIRTAEAKAAMADLRGDISATTAVAKKAATETANAAKAPLAILNRPAPVDFSAQMTGGAAAAQSQAAYQAAVTGATRAIADQSAALAKASVEAIEYRADIEAIRAQFVPAAAAAQKYEKQLLAISAAEELGALSAKEAAAARKQAAAATEAVGKASAGAAGGLRGFGMQLNQVATVGGMTGDWMSAIAIQLPDMLMAFGTLGIFAGVAAGALIPLVSSLGGATDYAEATGDAMDAAADAIDRAREAAHRATGGYAELRDEFVRITGDVQRMVEAQSALAKLDATQALNSARDTAAGYIDVGAMDAMRGYADTVEGRIRMLRDQLSLTDDDARILEATFQRLASAGNADEMAAAFQSIRAEVVGAAGGMEFLNAEQEEVVRAALEGEDAARRFAAIDLAAGVSAAADEAARLAENMGLSLTDAINLVNLTNEAMAAGRIGAGAGRGGDPRQFEDDPYWKEKYFPDPLEYPKPKKGRAGGKSDAEKASDKAARQAERDARQVADYISGVQAEIDALHELDPVQQEIIRNREILDKASPEQRLQIEGLIRQRVETESLRDIWGEVGNTMYDALEGAALQGDKLSDVLGNVGRMAAQAAFQAAMLGTGPLAGVLGFGGSGLIGMGISALMGSSAPASTGGTVTPFLDLFDTGGWTGGADPSTVVGLVHGREYVFDAKSTEAIGVKNLDALRRSARFGYRDGGFALSSGPAPSLAGGAAGAAGTAPREIVANFHISVSGTGNSEITEATRTGIAQALDLYDRHVLPIRLGQITSDPRSIG